MSRRRCHPDGGDAIADSEEFLVPSSNIYRVHLSAGSGERGGSRPGLRLHVMLCPTQTEQRHDGQKSESHGNFIKHFFNLCAVSFN